MSSSRVLSAEASRRRERRGWLPSVVILAILIAAGVVTALVLQGVQSIRSAPTALGPNGSSTFGPAGIKYIERTRTVRVDLSGSTPSAATLGLTPNGTVTVRPSQTLVSTLRLAGDGTATETPIDSVEITTRAGAISVVRWSTPASIGFADLSSALLDSTAFGVDPAAIDAVLTGVRVANRQGTAYSHTFAPATALGSSVTISVRCLSASACSASYVATLM